MSVKYFSVVSVFVVLLAVASVSCTRHSKERLRAEVSEINSACPINEGFAGDLVSISYSNISNEVDMDFSVNEYFTKISTLRENRELQLNCLRISFLDERASALLNRLCDAKAILNVTYRNEATDESINFRIPTNELQGISAAKLTETERDSVALSASVKLDNADCPREIANGLNLIEVRLWQKELTFVVMVKDEISLPDENIESYVHHAIIANMLNQQIEQCRTLNVKIICRIILPSGDPVSYSIVELP